MIQESRKHAKKESSKLLKPLLLLMLLMIAMSALSACGAAATEAPAAPEEPAVPEAPAATEAPAEPVEPSEQYPVQYGQDTRMEPFQHSDTKLKEMAASVAIFVHKDQVVVSGNSVTLDGYTLNEMSEMGWLVSNVNVPMCADELFSSQAAPGFCTGFLVAEDILVTAGHCLQKTACADTSIVFGFQMASDSALAELTKDDVFECAEVLAQALPAQENGYLDYAIIKLERPTGRAGLAYSTGDLLQAQDNVAVMGYPSGLPQKIASNAFVLSNDSSSPFFVANLDTFGSNSGSPVINTSTYQVEGILVRGTTDYVLSSEATCVQVNRCPEGGDANCAGENATKMAMLAERISESIASGSGGLNWGLNCSPALLFALVLVALARLKFSS
jgi:V8-like Glu-specific endopeptidase